MKKESSWMMNLTPEQLHIIRDHGTEVPGSSPLNYEWREGVYQCIACHAPLFKANMKFESGCGWPSFFSVINGAIETEVDTSHHMKRIEVHCARCKAHLGHLFQDGPVPNGERYCINGIALNFERQIK